MTALKNNRHELFAQRLAEGKTADAAYQLAGFKANRGNAIRLKADERIQARVAELLKAGADQIEITEAAIARELARIGFSDLRKAVKWGADGVAVLESDGIGPDTAAAIAEVAQTKEGVRIKFHDKRSALVDLGRLKGYFKDDPAKAGDIHVHFDVKLQGVL